MESVISNWRANINCRLSINCLSVGGFVAAGLGSSFCSAVFGFCALVPMENNTKSNPVKRRIFAWDFIIIFFFIMFFLLQVLKRFRWQQFRFFDSLLLHPIPQHPVESVLPCFPF